MRSRPQVGTHVTLVSIASSAACADVGARQPAERPVHRDEPLRRGEKDDRVVAPPAVRIRVLERLAMPQASALLQRLLDLRVGIEDPLAAEELDGFQEVAARTDRRVDLETVLDSGHEVVAAVPRRGVDRTGARLERDVVGEDADRIARIERMTEADVLELSPLHARDRRRRASRPPASDDPGGERFGDDHGAAVDLVSRIVELRVECDRQIRRNGPRRRRPDEDRHLSPRKRRHARRQLVCARLRERELDVDRRR